ncbi:MAG: DUF664 domain-containing protein [Armatimonadetes bacterium]|nr:DUF664 domain-containing protein [Armatimonadota bacterium]
MASVDLLWKALDSAIWEMSEAFKGLKDEDVWTRPDPRLLSVGELAAHTAYWEAMSFIGKDFESPLSVQVARYYTANEPEPFSLPMSAEAVYEEVKRVHEACKAAFAAEPHEFDDPSLHREGWTYGYVLIYQGFHVAYHTGQMYSVRHLMGHETADN